MKQTEIGLIPDDWEVKSLGDLAFVTKLAGFEFTAHVKYSDLGKIIALRGLNVRKGFLILDDVKYIDDSNFSKLGRSRLFIDDLLFTYVGTVGNAALVDKNNIYYLAPNVALIRCNKHIHPKFLMYLILSKSFFDKQISTLMSTTSQAALSMTNIRLFEIPIPPFAEQQRIAKALSDVDALIFTTEKLLQKKRNIKQGTMQELLTGKKRLPGFAKSNNTKMTELGEIPEDWEVKNIMDILISSKDKLKIGPFGSQLKKEYLLSNGFYKVFGQENIYSGNFEYCYRFLTKEHFQKLQSCELKPGDFVISTMGTIGKCDIVPENAGVGIMDSHLVRLRLLNSMDKNFFKYFFQSDLIQKQIVALSVGGIMDGLSTAIIKKLNVIEFSKEEQNSIAKILSDMDNEIDLLNTKLEKYRNLKTAMMQQLLTGKIRL